MDDFREDHFCIKRERNDLKKFHNTKWKPHRLNVISELKELAEEAQKCKTDQRIGQIVYSSAGIASGVMGVGGIVAAPFTAGASLGLTAVSLGIGATAGAADITHSVVANRMSESKVRAASEICKKDFELTEELQKYINNLINKINDIITFTDILKEVASTTKDVCKTGYKIYSAVKTTKSFLAIQAKNVDKAAKLLDMSKYVQKVLPSCLKKAKVLTMSENGVIRVANAASALGTRGGAAAAGGIAARGFTRLATKIALPITIGGLALDIWSIVDNAKKLQSGELSQYAQDLMKAAEELETQMREYDGEIECLLKESKDF